MNDNTEKRDFESDFLDFLESNDYEKIETYILSVARIAFAAGKASAEIKVE